MGCWNGTCAVSNLHITAGTPVTVFLLLEQRGSKSFCYSNALNDLCPVPFYGEYNDYGAVENCHGFGLNMVVDALRDQLYEFGEGPNSSHDMSVNKDNFNIEMLFEADHEDRLGIQETYRWDGEEYDRRELEKMRLEEGLSPAQAFELDRLANKIKKVDTFRRVTHVIVHGAVFHDIMHKWYIEDYVGDSKGDKGYQNNYRHIYFQDILNDLPAYIQSLKSNKEELDNTADPKLRMAIMRLSRSNNFDNPNLAAKWMGNIDRSESMKYGIVHAEEVIEEYKGKDDWAGLASFMTEVLTTLWMNAFMGHTRKLWSKQSGSGSQNSDHLAYRVLTQSMNDIMDVEQAELDEINAEDEEFDEIEADASAG